MSVTKQTRAVGAEIGAALVLTIILGSALGADGGLVPAVPLLITVAYWAGKVRQSGLGWTYFSTKVVDMPLERKVEPRGLVIPESQEVTNVIRPLKWGKSPNWNPCRTCKANFTSEPDLLAHELDAHGDDFFRGLEAA